ncbi:MAG TPA: BtpA/SgcQ family protein [Thermomicrobiaceae bacterium]|nr:BtpA/SgcQ family protein [Thermomicrobiaceae bacterium]
MSQSPPPIVGVVHLPALPGSPRAGLSLDAIIASALRDARAYAEGGASALIVENFHDVPFRKEQVEPPVIAAMTLAVRAVRQAVALPLGVNVLRNDAGAALAIAAVTGAAFIRVNIHSGALVTDQGIIQTLADDTLRQRRALGAEQVAIWADVLVKHASPLGPIAIEDAADDLIQRELADAVIVTGRATGRPADPEELSRLRAAFPAFPLYVGSGVTAESIADYLPAASGFIVGTWVKEGGHIERPVDPARVARLVAAARC